jgi:hypothetical protein
MLEEELLWGVKKRCLNISKETRRKIAARNTTPEVVSA